jgi:hypothetical protein
VHRILCWRSVLEKVAETDKKFDVLSPVFTHFLPRHLRCTGKEKCKRTLWEIGCEVRRRMELGYEVRSMELGCEVRRTMELGHEVRRMELGCVVRRRMEHRL